MGQGTESSETCADRPTEVSVIRFVSRNRTIEEIAPKKDVYVCKQRGCGKIFTKFDEYKTHEAIESLKIRFICREPGCGEEVPDPGSMWRHYQEWHNNDTNVFVCPYTSCGSIHASSEILEEHIEASHRHYPTIPTEPEIICFEGPDNVIDEDTNRSGDDGFDRVQSNTVESADSGVGRKNEYSCRNESSNKQGEYRVKEEKRIMGSKAQLKNDFPIEQSKLRAALSSNDYSKNNETLNIGGAKFPKNKDLLITKENFFVKYEARSPIHSNESAQNDSSQDANSSVFINNEVSLTKNPNQEHRIELGNLEKVFRSGFERASIKKEDTSSEVKNDCSDDEEYTPKKQRMSRCKQESYKCEVSGCGKSYKYISHFRHHQDSHKLIANATLNSSNSTKTTKTKNGKGVPTTCNPKLISCRCKMKNCRAQLSTVSTLWRHYQDKHINEKPPKPKIKAKGSEVFRCKTSCNEEFSSSIAMYTHSTKVHPENSINNISTNIKTGNGNGLLVEQMFRDNTSSQHVNFKTDLKAKHSVSLNEYADNNDKKMQSSIIKEETGD